MKSLKTLIKLHKKELDDKRLELAREEKTLEDLEKILSKVQSDMKNEAKVAGGSLDASYTFPSYIEQAIDSEKKIKKLIEEQKILIDKIRNEISEKFSELKKFEILLEVKEKEALALADKLEQQRLDEIAINSFLNERKEPN